MHLYRVAPSLYSSIRGLVWWRFNPPVLSSGWRGRVSFSVFVRGLFSASNRRNPAPVQIPALSHPDPFDPPLCSNTLPLHPFQQLQAAHVYTTFLSYKPTLNSDAIILEQYFLQEFINSVRLNFSFCSVCLFVWKI